MNRRNVISQQDGGAPPRRRRGDPLGPGGVSKPLYEAKAELFRVLGHPARVRILELLRDGERSVGSLQGALGLDSSGTSQHLAALRKHGLVVSRRQGTSVYYTASDPSLFGLLAAGRDFLAASLDRQQALLEELAGSLVRDGADTPGGADA